jgi:CelD/BcsL family acetyltransferase involved in cellulose biosynthesis
VTASDPQLLNVDDPRWSAFVDACPDALPFHHPAWLRLLADCYGFRPLVVFSGEAGLPVLEVRGPLGGRRWISLPFTDLCPPLGPSEQLLPALDVARRAAGVARLEVRAPLPGVPGRVEAVRHALALSPDVDAVFRGFHKSQVQRNIRRAEREGVTVRRAAAETDLADVFYRLQLATRRRLGVPVQPRRFFRLLWQLLEAGHGYALLAEADGKPVAGAVFLTQAETVVYKFGASDSGAWSLRPNHALFWHAIQESCADGYRSFDFGRSDLEDTGLREFKSGWGAEEEELVYSVLGGAPRRAAAPGGGMAARVIRSSPPIVCRAAGELLYRYAA